MLSEATFYVTTLTTVIPPRAFALDDVYPIGHGNH